MLSPFADSTSDTGTETPPPEKRLVRGPVGWLLGADLFSKIGKVLRHRADPRHWMPFRPGEVHDERSAAARGERIEITRTAAERGAPAVQPAKSLPETDVWFDYVADSGDDNDAMYAIAYASMVGFVAPSGGLSTATWKRSEPTRLTVAPAGGGALPRGQFLFFGGDTAYHVADAATLRARVEVPFRWAFDDAKSLKHVAPGASVNAVTRRIYGIPGNHDWYDNLKGFAQVFRIAARSTSGQPAPTGPIVLPELAPVQLASYVAIQLPYGWQLWGLDVDDSLGDQQRTYFESLRDLNPERLIVATASPAYVFGARLMKEGHCGAAEALGLPVPKPDGAAVDGDVRYRLDLSGDVHHYARYFPDGDGQRYGSVVSGLGGAFHHPSFTRATGVDQRREPVIEYPSCDESLRSLGEGLLTARSTWFGSWARVVPFVLTFLLAFVGTHAAGGAWLLDQLFSLVPGHQPLSRGGVMDLLRSLCWLGVLGVAVGGVVVALVFARRVARAHVDTPAIAETFTQVLFGDRGGRLRRLVGVRRSYWFPWVIAIATTAPLFLYPLWGVTARTRGLDVAAVVILVALPLAGGVVAFRHGARHLALGTRLWVALIGVVHGAMQVVGAAVLARVAMASWAAAGATVGVVLVLIAFTPLVRPLFRCERRRSMVGLAVVAVVAFSVSMGLVLWAGGGRVVVWPDGAWMEELEAFGRHFLAALVAMPFGTMWFMWYLAVAGRAGAHNNELGAAAGVSSYRQLIRFHVHAEGLTGYVIAARTQGAAPAARTGGTALIFELIDVFTIAAPTPTRPVGPPP